MRDLTEALNKRIIKKSMLEAFGFKKNGGTYEYREFIADGKFEVYIYISDDKNCSKVVDVENEFEYALVDVEDAVGEFVGNIRAEYDRVMHNFFEKCTRKDVFKTKQSKMLIEYIGSKYGDELEFLWEKFDDNAVWRNKENNKWYATLFTILPDRIGIEKDGVAEVTNVMYKKGCVEEIINNKTVFPAYHMNKQSWITIKLDDEVDMNYVFELIDNSYKLSCEKK